MLIRPSIAVTCAAPIECSWCGRGCAAGKHRGLPAGGGAGTAAVYAPEGLSGPDWDAGTEILLFKMARHAVEDALWAMRWADS